MSHKKYIKNELKQLRKDCEKYGMSPLEWIQKFADQYHKKYTNQVVRRGKEIE